MSKVRKIKVGEKIKSPAFLLCDNPMAEKGQEYILYNRDPKLLMKIFNLTAYTIEQREMFLSEVVAFGACEVFGVVYYIIPFEQYSKPPENFDFAKLMKRTADWFKAYLIWEENNFN